MALELSLSIEDYEWTRPLVEGEVTPDGIDLTVVPMTSGGERHRRMLDGEFDAAEFSIGMYLAGWPDLEFTAIPAFPRRFFPHSRIVVNADAGIERPSDLAGKRVGIQYYQNTHALWTRGILAERHGLDLDAVEWLTTKPEPIDREPPVPLGRFDRSEGPDLVSRGDLDALVISKTAELYPLPENVDRLFPDPKTTERRYYEETGLYPLMHNVVLADEVVDEHPWVVGELLDLFRRSHERATERYRYASKYPLVWWQKYREDERDVFGDLWSGWFEYEANAAEAERMVEYAVTLDLLDEPVDAREMYRTG